MNIINIFVTGGLDSTYRLYELSQNKDIVIQPYYIITDRLNRELELHNIYEIINILNKYNNIKNPIVYFKNQVPKFKNILYCSKIIHKVFAIGNQYTFLSHFLSYKKIQCEISLERKNNELGNIQKLVYEFIDLEEKDGYYIPVKPKNENVISYAIYGLFKNYLFPTSVWNITKKEELSRLEKKCPEIIKYIVFCHCTNNGKPCGKCNPCKSYKEEDLFEYFEKLHK